MNNSSSSIKIIIQFFKNNHFKMIFFILITLFLTYLINEQYYKNKKPYSYVVDIMINQNKSIWWIGGQPGDELLYFFQKEGYKNVILNKESNVSQNLGIKIFTSSKVDKIEYIKIIKTLNEFKNQLITRSEEKLRFSEKVTNDFIKISQDSKIKGMALKSLDRTDRLLSHTMRNKEFKDFINQDLFYYLYDFNEDKIQKVNKKVMQKLIITFILSIICILMILWIKLFIREIKINQ